MTDGYVLNDALPFEFTNIARNVVYKKLITVQRGPIAYKSNPIPIVWESACGDYGSE